MWAGSDAARVSLSSSSFIVYQLEQQEPRRLRRLMPIRKIRRNASLAWALLRAAQTNCWLAPCIEKKLLLDVILLWTVLRALGGSRSWFCEMFNTAYTRALTTRAQGTRLWCSVFFCFINKAWTQKRGQRVQFRWNAPQRLTFETDTPISDIVIYIFRSEEGRRVDWFFFK